MTIAGHREHKFTAWLNRRREIYVPSEGEEGEGVLSSWGKGESLYKKGVCRVGV